MSITRAISIIVVFLFLCVPVIHIQIQLNRYTHFLVIQSMIALYIEAGQLLHVCFVRLPKSTHTYNIFC